MRRKSRVSGDTFLAHGGRSDLLRGEGKARPPAARPALDQERGCLSVHTCHTGAQITVNYYIPQHPSYQAIDVNHTRFQNANNADVIAP